MSKIPAAFRKTKAFTILKRIVTGDNSNEMDWNEEVELQGIGIKVDGKPDGFNGDKKKTTAAYYTELRLEVNGITEHDAEYKRIRQSYQTTANKGIMAALVRLQYVEASGGGGDAGVRKDAAKLAVKGVKTLAEAISNARTNTSALLLLSAVDLPGAARSLVSKCHFELGVAQRASKVLTTTVGVLTTTKKKKADDAAKPAKVKPAKVKPAKVKPAKVKPDSKPTMQ